MKSEHRHELQTNELTRYADAVVGWFRTYGNHVMIVVCVVSIVAAGLIYWQRTEGNRASEAWNELAAATTASQFQLIASDPALSKTSAAPWAKIQEADAKLQEGIRLAFTDRDRGLRELTESKSRYEDLLRQTSLDPLIRERALFGLARCQETLSSGSLDEAIATYEKLIKEFPDSVYKPAVQQRTKELGRPGAKDFYAWFSKQKPTSVAPSRQPADKGVAGAKKAGLSDLKMGKRDASPNPPADLPTVEEADEKQTDGPRLEAPGADTPPATPPAAPAKSPDVKAGAK